VFGQISINQGFEKGGCLSHQTSNVSCLSRFVVVSDGGYWSDLTEEKSRERILPQGME